MNQNKMLELRKTGFKPYKRNYGNKEINAIRLTKIRMEKLQDGDAISMRTNGKKYWLEIGHSSNRAYVGDYIYFSEEQEERNLPFIIYGKMKKNRFGNNYTEVVEG